MPNASSVDIILDQAREREREYDWLGAVDSYGKALNLVSETDFLKLGQVQEGMGYAIYRAAMQAESPDEFRDRMCQAVADYEKAKESYKKSSRLGEKPRTIRCDAMIAYLGYWLASDVSEKKRLIDECWQLTKKALKAFKEVGESLEYGKTYSQLSSSAYDKFSRDWNFQASEKTIREAAEHGEQAINLLSGTSDAPELARVYVRTGVCLSMLGYGFIPDMDEKEKYYQRSRGYWKKANELSEETAFLELSNKAGAGFVDWSFEEILVLYEKAWGRAKKTKDKYLIGNALDWLAFASFWESERIEDPDKRTESLHKALQYAEDAQDNFSCISFASPRGWVIWTGAPYTEYYCELALRETDKKKRRDLLKRAVMNEVSMMKLAESTGYPEIVEYAHHALSKALCSLAQIETNPEEKRRLLTKALEHRNESVRLDEQFCPFRYWDRGVAWNYLAGLKAELSNLENDSKKKQKMLEEAVSNNERCLQLCLKEMPYWEKVGGLSFFAALGSYQHSYGKLLNRLYRLIGNSEHQKKAIKAFEDVAESFGKLDMSSRVAECRWEIARGFEALGNYPKAAESFDSAANNYARACEKIPQLSGFYSDYVSYMRAWAEIERSRHERENENYAESRKYYHECSRLLKMTKKWSYLSQYYFAWSLLDHGENLSRHDKPKDAIKAFNEAGRTFEDSASSLRVKAEELEDSEERNGASRLADTAGLRRQYCIGRVLMEEATLSSRKGDRVSSANKYASASEIFKEIAPNLEREEAREELQFAASISEAWEKMELAEERGDHVLYKKAAKLFARAGEVSRRKIAKWTAMGNSCFCEALEMGTKFMATSNTDFYAGAKSRMENAAGYYQRAGFKKTALLVEATKRLLDAYVYVGRAEAETEPEKRVKFYLMAEKCLTLSAKSYGKAGYRGKKSEVLQNLERVRKERRLAFSLSEVLTAPAVLSSTTRVSMPDLTEKSAGLNSFESVNIRANISPPKEFVPSEEFEIRLDLANVGNKPGLLVRIDDLVPPRCEVLKVPSYCELEGASLNMRGKKLNPLCVESINIRVQIPEIASVSLSPQVVYVDELGNFITTKVEEVKILPVVKFESKVAQDVFGYLVDAFIEDYVKRRLGVEKSGWRSLPKIIKEAKVSKWSLYGAGGRLGPNLSELQRKGLADVETLLGERGRGGHILRVRIHYEKELVRRYVKEKAPDLLT